MELHTVSGVRQQLRCLAAIVLFGMVPAASAAWFDEPAVGVRQIRDLCPLIPPSPT